MFLWQSLLNILTILLTQKDYVQLKVILEAPAPKDLNQMRSFLSLVNYYAKFIPTVLHPLNRLLRQDVSWEWDELCEDSFKLAKQSLASSRVLVHYDSTLPLKLAGGASEYSHTCVPTGQRGQLHLRLEHCLLAREIMPNWKKKLIPSYSVFVNSTSIFMDVHLLCIQIISR